MCCDLCLQLTATACNQSSCPATAPGPRYVERRLAALIERQGAEGEAVGAKVTLTQFGSLAVLAALLGWLSLAVTRRIMAQLGADPGDAGLVADRIAGGQLDREVEGAVSHPGSMMASLARMQDELRSRAALAGHAAARPRRRLEHRGTLAGRQRKCRRLDWWN